MADDNPLARWTETERSPATGPTGKPVYIAFKPLDRRQLRVHVCPRGQHWEWLPYLGLTRIMAEADYGTRLALFWSYAVVVIKGRNLQELESALAQDRCQALRAFDPERHDPPVNPEAAYIDSIEIITAPAEEAGTLLAPPPAQPSGGKPKH